MLGPRCVCIFITSTGKSSPLVCAYIPSGSQSRVVSVCLVNRGDIKHTDSAPPVCVQSIRELNCISTQFYYSFFSPCPLLTNIPYYSFFILIAVCFFVQVHKHFSRRRSTRPPKNNKTTFCVFLAVGLARQKGGPEPRGIY